SPNGEGRRMTRASPPFVLRASTFFRHSSFGFRHSKAPFRVGFTRGMLEFIGSPGGRRGPRRRVAMPFGTTGEAGRCPHLADRDEASPAISPRDPLPAPSRPKKEAIPVARPAPRRPRLQDDPDPPPMADLLAPTSVKGWSVSLVLHALVLLAMAVWYFAP